MKKKVLNFSIQVVVGIILGLILVMIPDQWWDKVFGGMFSGGGISFFVVLIIIVLVYYISIGLHELGHFAAFRYNKISMRMLSIVIFSFIFNGSKWKLILNYNGHGIGGIAVPNLTVIPSKKEFKHTQKAYANAILWGPITSFILILVGILFLFGNNNMTRIGLLFIIVNSFLFLGCFIKADGVYGDFPAYKAFKEDDFFAALMMYQYAMFAVDYKNIRKNNTYLRNVLIKEVQPRMERRQLDLLTVSCATTFIQEYLVGMTDQVPEHIKEYIDYYYDNYKTILATKNAEANKELLRFIAYCYQKQGSEDKAIGIHRDFIQKLPKTKVFNYWKIQSEQIILGTDHSAYLSDKNNIKPSATHVVFKKLEGAYHDELILNKL